MHKHTVHELVMKEMIKKKKKKRSVSSSNDDRYTDDNDDDIIIMKMTMMKGIAMSLRKSHHLLTEINVFQSSEWNGKTMVS